VARGTQHRKRRPKPDARAAAIAATPARKQKPPQWQEELFFQRLRNHAKWMFVLLALVFAVGFVFFGVGSGNGISDALQNAFSFGHSAGGTSVSKLQKKVDAHPKDATAWRDLATALEQKQNAKDAVTALEHYTALRPKDQGALSELAAQYNNLSTTYANEYSAAQAQAAAQSPPGEAFAPPANSPFGKAFADPAALKDPIAAAVSTVSSTAQSTAYTSYIGAQQKAVAAYKKLAALNPNEATTQIQLGQAALGAKDTATAIAAFEKFLKLAPTDPAAAQVKQALKQLKASAAASASASASG
jgi:cytochrome c-type biogenesis protein CcmH/NrfG